MSVRVVAVLAAAILFIGAVDAPAGTLDDVRVKGFIQCGVNHGLPGFSAPDQNGTWRGMDVDICRAVSAAVFSDPEMVKFTPLSAKQRFTALQSGEVDVLSRNTTWTMLRDTALGLNFAGIIYYDGQGFMVRKKLSVASALELSGTTVCVQSGTTTELNIADYFGSRKMPFELLRFDQAEATVRAYEAGRCDVYTADKSQLHVMRLRLAGADDHVILPEIISKEPLGPVVRQGDEQWFNLVKWTVFAMINAEELGVTSQNVDEMKASENPAVRRLLGIEGDFGQKLGLANDWAYNIIKHVGNYGEVFERNVGSRSTLKIARGVNALWRDGGLLYAPPIR